MITAHEPVQKGMSKCHSFPIGKRHRFPMGEKAGNTRGSWLFYLGKIRQREQSCVGKFLRSRV